MSDDHTGRELRRFLNERIPPASPGLSERVLAHRAEARDTTHRPHWLVPALAVVLAIALVAALTLGPRLVRPGRVPAGSSSPQVFRDGPRTADCQLQPSPDRISTGIGLAAFVSDGEGWLATTYIRLPAACGRTGSRTEVFHTTDGGKHWTAQLLFDGLAREMRFDPDGGGMVLAQSSQPGPGEGGHPALYRTTDRGAHWEAVSLPGAPLAWGTGDFRDARTGWLLVYPGTVYKTMDAGKSWTSTPFDVQQAFGGGSALLQGVLRVWDAQRAVYFSTAVYATSDGGASWQDAQVVSPAVTPPGSSRAVSVVPAAARETGAGIALVVESKAGSPSRTSVFTTADAGSHWSFAGEPPLTPMTIAALDADRWWLATGRDLTATADGGRTWQTRRGVLPAGMAFQSLGFTSPEQGWAVAGGPAGGESYTSADGGAHWTQRTTPPPPPIS